MGLKVHFASRFEDVVPLLFRKPKERIAGPSRLSDLASRNAPTRK